jgi:hypothetical protein
VRQQYMDRLARLCGFAVPSQCPFCAAIASPPFGGGEEIIVLSGVLTGLRAKVLSPPYPDWLEPGEILIRPMGGEAGNCRFNQRSEIAQRLPGLDRPEWFPPISLRDAADLHEAVLKFCLRHDWDHAQTIDPQELYILVNHI